MFMRLPVGQYGRSQFSTNMLVAQSLNRSSDESGSGSLGDGAIGLT
jgi:hypothetical protein